MRSHKPKTEKFIHGPTVSVAPLCKPPKLNFDELKVAIVDGVLQCKVGDQVILRKDHLNDPKLYLCTVTSIHENGDLVFDNQTLGQKVIFNVKDPMNIKLFMIKE